MSERAWSEEEIARFVALVETYQHKKPWSVIAAKMNRTAASCAHKWTRMSGRVMGGNKTTRTYQRARHDDSVETRKASPKLLAERDRRAELLPRDLTSALMGDPLPGYSALERPSR